jgi:hypothetical protein
MCLLCMCTLPLPFPLANLGSWPPRIARLFYRIVDVDKIGC